MRLKPIIQVSPMGALGNRMIQYLAALTLASRVKQARMVQIHLPEWGIQIAPAPPPERIEVVTSPALEFDRLAMALNDGAIGGVDIRTYAQRMENFMPAGAYRSLFGAPSPDGAGPGELLINIRGGDILDGHHPDYVLVPIDFYVELVERTGLSPVFLGQLDETSYLAALRARFPDARFVPSEGAIADFAVIRGSVNIVPAISTFSWLAAWLSEASQVFMPVLGLFNPLQSRATQLLPFDDQRFRFILFPHHYAVPVEGFAAAHAAVRGLWRPMGPAKLRALMTREPPARDRAAYLDAYNEAFYITHYPDIREAIIGGHMPSGRHHYEHYGFAEGRLPCRVDAAWYCQRYPIAAIEMGQSEAADPVDHWIAIGRERGYRPVGE